MYRYITARHIFIKEKSVYEMKFNHANSGVVVEFMVIDVDTYILLINKQTIKISYDKKNPRT